MIDLIMAHPVMTLVALYLISQTIILPFQFYFQYRAFRSVREFELRLAAAKSFLKEEALDQDGEDNQSNSISREGN